MYRVEHQDTNGVWHRSHRGTFKQYSAALAKRDEVGAFGRIMQKIGNVWEECAAWVPPADRVVQMTLACKNVDRDSGGWYALRVDKANGGKETVGRGPTAWDAVRNAHAG